MENTFARGQERGRTNTSPRKGKFVCGPMRTEFEKPETGSSALPVNASQAAGSDGIAPPLARMAIRFATAPIAMSVKPGCSRLRMSAARTARVEMT